VEFFDIVTGQKLMVKERVIPGTRINVESLVSGTYIVRFVSNDYKIMHQFKLIKL
jgi:hypothetical protein